MSNSFAGDLGNFHLMRFGSFKSDLKSFNFTVNTEH
ncbi:MAG: hypothetical protein ACI9OE_002828 [Mariniflexile sp.]|jgi:hypothetical protein